MTSPFSVLPTPTPDPLFAIGAEANAAGPDAINGTLGISMDENGKPLLFPSVQKILEHLEKHLQGFNYSYPLLTGLPQYRDAVTRLLSPDDKDIVASIAATGGTGALALNLRLLNMLIGDDHNEMIVAVPAWANHLPVCRWAGLTVIEAPYMIEGKASVDGIIDAVNARVKPFGILLQVGCHNPTGLDLDAKQWSELFDALGKKECVVLLDFAYQGFKAEPEEDRLVIRACTDRGLTTLVAWSASKNHSIYGLRTGIAAAFVRDMIEKKNVEGTYCTIVRGLHSAAPTFGQAIVALVQQRAADAWKDDLREARATMRRKRDLMLTLLPPNFEHCLRGHGMFAMLPLTAGQIERLKTVEKVFLAQDGRINIAGIPETRIEELCVKIESVLF